MNFMRTWWNEQTDRSRAALMTAFLLVITLITGWFFFMPFVINVQTLTTQKDQLALDVGELRAFSDSLEEHEQERQQLLVESVGWQKKLPNQVQTASVLRQLDAQALQAGVRLIGVKPQPARTNGNLTEVPFEVTANGDFFAALRFLQQLETQGAPAMRVASFTLSAEQTGTTLKQVYLLAAPGLATPPKIAAGLR